MGEIKTLLYILTEKNVFIYESQVNIALQILNIVFERLSFIPQGGRILQSDWAEHID